MSEVNSVLRGRRVVLRPIVHDDLEELFLKEVSGEALGPRWRLRGQTPSPTSYSQFLYTGVLCQFLVFDGRERLVGIVCAYEAHFENATVWIAFASFAPNSTLSMFEAVVLFVEYLFKSWPFRKLYGESIECNLSRFASGLGSVFVEEGRLEGHTYLGGRWWDQVTVALYRDDWAKVSPRWLDFALGARASR